MFSTAVGVVFLTLLCCPQKRCFIDENLIVLHICKILFKSAVFTFWYPRFLHGVILKNRESETIMASHPPLPSRSSCLLADIVLLNHVEREE